MKTYDYIITFKSRNPKIVDRISLFMLLLAVAVFIFSIFTTPLSRSTFFFSVITLLIIGYVVYLNIQEGKGKAPYYRIALALAS